MKVRSIDGQMAQVESGGLIRSANVQLVPTVKPGDYVIVHAGFAIQRLDPAKARETLRMINEIC